MLTVALVAMPQLGNSVVRGLQRILGSERASGLGAFGDRARRSRGHSRHAQTEARDGDRCALAGAPANGGPANGWPGAAPRPAHAGPALRPRPPARCRSHDWRVAVLWPLPGLPGGATWDGRRLADMTMTRTRPDAGRLAVGCVPEARCTSFHILHPTPYPSCGTQAWWVLGLTLCVFTFLAVASSFFLLGKQYLYPPMVVAAFIGERW